MILLGVLVWANLSPGIIGSIGRTIFLGHNVIDLLHSKAIDTAVRYYTAV